MFIAQRLFFLSLSCKFLDETPMRLVFFFYEAKDLGLQFILASFQGNITHFNLV